MNPLTKPVYTEAELPALEDDRALDGLLEAAAAPPAVRPFAGVALGVIVGRDASGAPMVAVADRGASPPLRALSTVAVPADAAGREVALLFIGDNLDRPLIVGLIQPPAPGPAPRPDALLDGQRLEITAERDIVLRCGAASITLTREGKILIEGTYLLSRSRGVNRIKGGSVQIN